MAGIALQGPRSATHGRKGLQGCTLKEQFPGVPVQALSQKRAQSGCQLGLCQLLDGKLAGTNKAKAAS
jgi:hypothetical protein